MLQPGLIDKGGLNRQPPSERPPAPSPQLPNYQSKEKEFTAKYNVTKAAEEQHYTLGVSYPANEVDAHGEYTTPEELEKTAWQYMASHGGIGLQHENGTLGHGKPVESYIYRGPDWPIADQVIKSGDWMLGVVWDDAAWALIKSGFLTGYSIDGEAYRKPTDPPSEKGGETT